MSEGDSKIRLHQSLTARFAAEAAVSDKGMFFVFKTPNWAPVPCFAFDVILLSNILFRRSEVSSAN